MNPRVSEATPYPPPLVRVYTDPPIMRICQYCFASSCLPTFLLNRALVCACSACFSGSGDGHVIVTMHMPHAQSTETLTANSEARTSMYEWDACFSYYSKLDIITQKPLAFHSRRAMFWATYLPILDSHYIKRKLHEVQPIISLLFSPLSLFPSLRC